MATSDEIMSVNGLQSMIDNYTTKITTVVKNAINFDSSNIGSAPNFYPTNIVANKNQISNSVPSISSGKMTGNTSDYKVQQGLQITGNNLIAQFINSLAVCSKYALIKVKARTNGNKGATDYIDQGQYTYFLLDTLPNSINFKTDDSSWQSYDISKEGRGDSISLFVNGQPVEDADFSTTLMPTINDIYSLQSTYSNKIKADEQVDSEDVNDNAAIFKAMYDWWNDQKMTYNVLYTRCYNDCHSSCHSSGRGWR